MSHTPGPWKLERKSVLIPIFPPHEWAEAYGGSEANARLIAAAPELLEACVGALAEIEASSLSEGYFFADDPTIIEKLKKVIAKAKGVIDAT
jgi:hypothetical protein